MVLNSNSRSFLTDQLSMYCISSFIQLSNTTSFLFGMICQVQVIPGFTDNLLKCQRSYFSTSEDKGGRGPINDISPFNTLNN